MADALTRRYIYPPNYQDVEGVIEDKSGHRRYILHITNISDGSGETDVAKFTLANHYFMGLPLVRTVIEWIEYDVFGMDVTLYWDRTGGAPNTTIARIPGGASTSQGKIKGPLTDPGSGDGSDGTGDILVTTNNHASGDSYDIRMSIKSKIDIKPQVGGEEGVVDADAGTRLLPPGAKGSIDVIRQDG